MVRMRIASYLLLLSLVVSSVLAEFLQQPRVQWSFSLPSLQSDGVEVARTLQQGNGIVASMDDLFLYITTQDGSLFILNITDGSLVKGEEYRPPQVVGALTTCRSGVALKQDVDGVDYAVYSIIDNPDTSAESNAFGEVAQSRIIALNADGTLRWIVTLEGTVAGTPAIGKDVIYVTHNIPNSDEELSGEELRGVLTILDADDGGIVSQLDGRVAPLGPVAVVQATDDSGDQVFCAEAYANSENQGAVLYLSSDKGLQVFSDWNVSSATRPAVSADGTMLWMGGANSRVGGWVGPSSGEAIVGNDTSADPTWEVSLARGQISAATPILNAPVAASDNSLLFITAAPDDIVCLDAVTGAFVWTVEDRDSFLVEPKYSDERNVLYTISRQGGRVRQLDAETGSVNWSIDCDEVSGDFYCEDDVEAEFSVSSSDNVIYYGDVFGKIVALQVATFETSAPVSPPPPTEAPASTISSPPSTPPTKAPSEAPTADNGAAVPTTNPSDVNAIQSSSPDNSSSTVMTVIFAVAAVVGVFALGILAYVFISHSRKNRKRNTALPLVGRGTKGDQKNVGAERGIRVELDSEGALIDSLDAKPKRKNKSSKKKTSPAKSPTRLAAIAESLDDGIEEEVDKKGFEMEQDEDGENCTFDYDQTTPDTSFSTSSASLSASSDNVEVVIVPDVAAVGVAVASTEDDHRSSKGRYSVFHPTVVVSSNLGYYGMDVENEDSESEADNTALVTAWSDEPRPYYMLDTRPGAAGSIMRVSQGGTQTLGAQEGETASRIMPQTHKDAPSIRRAQSSGMASPDLFIEDDEPGAIAPTTHEKQRSFAIDPAPHDGVTLNSMVPFDHGREESHYAREIAYPPLIYHVRSEGTTSPLYLEDDMSARSDDKSFSGEQSLVSATQDAPRSDSATQAPPHHFIPAFLLSRCRSDATTSTIYIEDAKQIAAESAVVPMPQKQGRSVYGVKTTTNENTLPCHYTRHRGWAASPTFIEAEAKASRSIHAPKSPVANREAYPQGCTFREQASPGSSIYIEESNGSFEVVSDDETSPLDEMASRAPAARPGITPTSVALDAVKTPTANRKDSLSGYSEPRSDNNISTVRTGEAVAQSTLSLRRESARLIQKQLDPAVLNKPLPRKGYGRGGSSIRTPQRFSCPEPKSLSPSSAYTSSSAGSSGGAVPMLTQEDNARAMRKIILVQTLPVGNHIPAKDPGSGHEPSGSSEQHIIPQQMKGKATGRSGANRSRLTTEPTTTEPSTSESESSFQEESPIARVRKQEPIRKAPPAVHSSSRSRSTKAVAFEKEMPPSELKSSISSLFGTLIERVEQVDQKFFNPKLIERVEQVDQKFFNPKIKPKKKSQKEKSVTNVKDVYVREIAIVSSDDESLPPPPPTHQSSRRRVG